MCRQAGAKLIWTKLSPSNLMEVASGPGVDFAAGQEGGYIFPRFLPAYDAVAALVHAFALLAATGTRLSAVVAALPPVFSAHEAVVTPWEKKGVVMRSLMEMNEDKPTTLVDGLKVQHGDGWCLIVPDPEEALTNVWAEALPKPAPGSGRRTTPGPSVGCCGHERLFGPEARSGSPGSAKTGMVCTVNVPDDLRYSADHEWVRKEEGRARVGITDYAQDALGDIVFVQMPELGALVVAGQPLCELESTKSVSDVYSPLDGTVVEVNSELGDQPERINEDPYGEGWICVIEAASLEGFKSLMGAEEYRKLLEV